MNTIVLNQRKYVILDHEHIMKKISLEAKAVYAMLSSIETDGKIHIIDHSDELLEIESMLEQEGLSFYTIMKELEDACIIKKASDESFFQLL